MNKKEIEVGYLRFNHEKDGNCKTCYYAMPTKRKFVKPKKVIDESGKVVNDENGKPVLKKPTLSERPIIMENYCCKYKKDRNDCKEDCKSYCEYKKTKNIYRKGIQTFYPD